MKEFMHVGVPTDIAREGEIYAEGIKTYIITPDTNEFHIEYLRFEKDTPLPEELQTLVHVAYKVDDMDKQLDKMSIDKNTESEIDKLLMGVNINAD